MDGAFSAGHQFLHGHARLLEMRLFGSLFERAPAPGVVDALRPYQNDDGGFGHALEPDIRCPASLPIYVETAFQVMDVAGSVDEEMVSQACGFFGPNGGANRSGRCCAPGTARHRCLPQGRPLDRVDLRGRLEPHGRVGRVLIPFRA